MNQGLEDKLLRVVDKFESEKGALTRDVASLTQRLVDARFNVNRYQEENVSCPVQTPFLLFIYLFFKLKFDCIPLICRRDTEMIWT